MSSAKKIKHYTIGKLLMVGVLAILSWTIVGLATWSPVYLVQSFLMQTPIGSLGVVAILGSILVTTPLFVLSLNLICKQMRQCHHATRTGWNAVLDQGRHETKAGIAPVDRLAAGELNPAKETFRRVRKGSPRNLS